MKNKKDFLRDIKENCLKEMAAIEVKIEVLMNLPPEEIIGSRKLGPDSSEELTAEKVIELKTKELSHWVQELNAVETLLKK